jgi:hypothetical protein
MSKGLNTIRDKVWHCLTLYPETRSSDRELILHLYTDFYGVFSQPFFKVLDRDDLPSFESIRRCRQMIQAEYEHLRAVPEVEEARIAKQEEYIAFARGEEA